MRTRTRTRTNLWPMKESKVGDGKDGRAQKAQLPSSHLRGRPFDPNGASVQGRSRVRVRIRTSFLLYYLASVCSGQFPLWSLVLTSSKLLLSFQQPPKSFQKLQLQQSEHHHSDWDKLNTEHTIQNNQLSQVDKMRKLYLI